jgi:hypothetical protein
MRYWWRRILNIATAGQLFRIFSMTYCIDCQKHFPFKGVGKLVSRDHNIKRLKHQSHTVRPLGKLMGKPKQYMKLAKVFQPPAGFQTPDSFGMEEYCESPPGSQEGEGSCGGWGKRGCLAVGTKLRKGKYPTSGWSSRVPYNLGRKIEGRLHEEGVFCTDVAEGVVRYGNCREVDWPYVGWEENSQTGRYWYSDPTVVVHPDAFIKVARSYAIIISVENLFAAVALYKDVYIGINWYENWMQVIGRKMPALKGSPIGGHSVHIPAFDKKKGIVTIQNLGWIGWGTLDKALAGMLISDLQKVFASGEFLIIEYDTPPDPQPQPEPDDWLEKLRKILEDFAKTIADFLDSLPKKAAR